MDKNIYPIPWVCAYCGSAVVYTSNEEIYGREYGNGKCYKCLGCDAYVGVHTGTRIPLGRLANRDLRELKKKCHSLFDPVWQGGIMTRSEAYSKLATLMDMPAEECHFGWFDKNQLLKSLEILKSPKWHTGSLDKPVCNATGASIHNRKRRPRPSQATQSAAATS